MYAYMLAHVRHSDAPEFVEWCWGLNGRMNEKKCMVEWVKEPVPKTHRKMGQGTCPQNPQKKANIC